MTEKISNRSADIRANQRVNRVLDRIYAHLGLSFSRVQDVSLDRRGVDVMFKDKGDVVCADEKAATAYWNRDLTTYACELTCRKTKYGLGWFAPEQNNYMKTNQYVFVWLRANDASLRRITKLQLMFVDKHELQEKFQAVCNPDGLGTFEMVEKLLGGNDRVVINNDVKLVRCAIYPEYPVNAVFSRDFLRSVATAEYTFGEREITRIICETRK